MDFAAGTTSPRGEIISSATAFVHEAERSMRNAGNANLPVGELLRADWEIGALGKFAIL